ncbi:hypothetical protein JTB14_001108 [Gonioctena quinquepunctata]|nr:hypothetical protein JTB14_001108 [Gonioctena quinquepunctata]
MEDIKNDVTELKEDVKALNNENEVLKENLMKIESSETNFDMEEFMNGMEERKKRSNNIMILNINESDAVNRNDRMKDENKTVKEVLAHADIALNEFKVIRMGKYDGRKIRPIKVILESNDAAVNILKNRKKINDIIPFIRIFADQTTAQREYYRKLKIKLNNIIAEGDNSQIIKYLYGIPKIVNKHDAKN